MPRMFYVYKLDKKVNDTELDLFGLAEFQPKRDSVVCSESSSDWMFKLWLQAGCHICFTQDHANGFEHPWAPCIMPAEAAETGLGPL